MKNNSIIKVTQILLENSKLGKSDINEIISFVIKREYSEIPFIPEYELSTKELNKIFKISKKVAKGKPLAYILGYKIFRSHKFLTNNRTLIPRIETEQLVDYVNGFIIDNPEKKFDVLDLCTGSGCVGISLYLENSNNIEKVVLSDISRFALKVANKNIIENKILDKVEIVRSNFMNVFLNKEQKFNILTCNPPYIDKNDANIDRDTVKYEPHLALFAKNNGLYFYEEIIKNIEKIIKVDQPFIVVLEIGWQQKNNLELLLNDKLGLKYNWIFNKDHFGNWRNLIITNREK
ncbi:peptide chain release factor N(5)-glutamine methyltransferase [Mesoplasma chauliocola]|nr:peptide chain release factor N(5)-glutamine methyltransferase [Mesoplasma chauliocola]